MIELITPKQIGLIREICRQLNRSAESAAREMFETPLEQLTKANASTLIDRLMEIRNALWSELKDYYNSAKLYGFNRSNASRRCQICGRKKYCSETKDGLFAVCVKNSSGSIGETRKGHHIHRLRHSTAPDTSLRREPPMPPSSPARVEPQRNVELLNIVYSSLIKLSPATLNTKELVTAPKGLEERGLANDAANYGMMPGPYIERLTLARKIIEDIHKEHSSHSLEDAREMVLKTPGFWLDQYDHVTIWLPKNHEGSALIIPYRDSQGRIQGCQLRDPHAPPEYRYQWLSSTPFTKEGPSPGTPIHFVQSSIANTEAARKILITEGALKGDAIGKFLTAYTITTTSGVTCSHTELIAAAKTVTKGTEPVVIAFDKDHRKNEKVCQQIARLMTGLLNERQSPRILVWSGRHKGLDDALLSPDQQDIEFKLLEAQQWLKGLTRKVIKEALKPLLQLEDSASELRLFADRKLAEIEAEERRAQAA